MNALAASPVRADYHVVSQIALNTDRGLVAVKQRKIGRIDFDTLLRYFDIANRIRAILRRISEEARLERRDLLVDDLNEFTERDVAERVDRQRIANIHGLHAVGRKKVFVWKDICERAGGESDPAVAKWTDRRILAELLPDRLRVPIESRAAADYGLLVTADGPGESELWSEIQMTSRCAAQAPRNATGLAVQNRRQILRTLEEG